MLISVMGGLNQDQQISVQRNGSVSLVQVGRSVDAALDAAAVVSGCLWLVWIGEPQI